MGKNKNKKKKVNAKRERYAKFRKEKPSVVDISTPELSKEQMKQKQDDEIKIARSLRFNRNPPPPGILKNKNRRM